MDGLVIDGNLDDGMNFYQSFYWTIKKQVSPRAAQLGIDRTQSAEIPQFRPGDKVNFLNEKLQVYATRTVASCGKDEDEIPEGMKLASEDGEPFRLYVPEAFTLNTKSGVSAATLYYTTELVSA